MRNTGIAWIVALVSVAGCGGSDSDGGKKEPGFEGGKNPTGSASKFTSFAVAAVSDLPTCKSEIEGSLAYLTSEKKFRVCASGAWTDVEVKGEAGKDGAQGPKGETGAAGENGVTKITATIYCAGDLSTLSDASRTLNGKTVSSLITVQYWSSTFANGDTFANAQIVGPSFAVASSRLYAGAQNGAADASVGVWVDVIAPDNFGNWNVSVNRSSGVATVRYTDSDFGQAPNYLEWSFQSSACTIQNW